MFVPTQQTQTVQTTVRLSPMRYQYGLDWDKESVPTKEEMLSLLDEIDKRDSGMTMEEFSDWWTKNKSNLL